KPEFNRDIRMGRSTKNLDSKCGLNAASAFFQIPDVLFLGFADPAQRGAEADSDAITWFFAGIIDLRVIQRELCRYYCELRVAIKPFQTLRRKKTFWFPTANLAGATNAENAWIEARDAPNAALFRKDSVPKIIDADANACDGTDARDDRAPPVHAATLFTLAST